MSYRWLCRAACALTLTLGSPLRSAGQAEVGWELQPERLQAASAATPYRVRVAAHEEGDDSSADGTGDDSDELSKRLEALEAKNEELESAYGALEKSLKGYAQTGHSASTMKISGRIHADLWGFPGDSPGVDGFESNDPNLSPQDRIEFRRVRFGVAGGLPSNMLYKIEMEFAGGDDSQFRDVYFGWEELPVFQTLLLGNQKRPYGLDHINSSRYNVFLERPFVIEGFNQDSRRFGLQSYGFSEDLAWNWRYGVFNQRLIQDEGRYVSDHWQGQVAGRLANTIWYDEASAGRGYAHWAIAGTWADTDQGADDENFADSGIDEARFRSRPEARTDSRWLDTGVITGSKDYSLLAFEGVVNVGACQLVAEHQQLWLNRVDNSPVHFHGSYAYVSYFLTGEHMPWDRETGMLGRIVPFEDFFLVDKCRGGCGHGLGAWQVAARWSYADFADQDILGGVGESVTLGLNWYWTPYSRMQFNYLYGEIEQNDRNAPAGSPNFGNYQVLGARFSVDF